MQDFSREDVEHTDGRRCKVDSAMPLRDFFQSDDFSGQGARDKYPMHPIADHAFFRYTLYFVPGRIRWRFKLSGNTRRDLRY